MITVKKTCQKFAIDMYRKIYQFWTPNFERETFDSVVIDQEIKL